MSPRGRGVQISTQQSKSAHSPPCHPVACTDTMCCFPPQPPLSKPGPGTGPCTSMSLPRPGLCVFPVYSCKDFNHPLVGTAGLGSGGCWLQTAKPLVFSMNFSLLGRTRQPAKPFRDNVGAALRKGKGPLLIAGSTWAPGRCTQCV